MCIRDRARLSKLGFEVVVESGAGAGAAFPDDEYQKAGARIAPTTRAVWAEADIVLKVQPPELHTELGHEADLLREGATRTDVAIFHDMDRKQGGANAASDVAAAARLSSTWTAGCRNPR